MFLKSFICITLQETVNKLLQIFFHDKQKTKCKYYASYEREYFVVWALVKWRRRYRIKLMKMLGR